MLQFCCWKCFQLQATATNNLRKRNSKINWIYIVVSILLPHIICSCKQLQNKVCANEIRRENELKFLFNFIAASNCNKLRERGNWNRGITLYILSAISKNGHWHSFTNKTMSRKSLLPSLWIESVTNILKFSRTHWISNVWNWSTDEMPEPKKRNKKIAENTKTEKHRLRKLSLTYQFLSGF